MTSLGLQPSAHVDTFARDHLPPIDAWPVFRFDLPSLRYPPRLNCAAALVDAHVAAGFGEHTAIVTPERRLTYAALLAEANRVAGVLRDDLRAPTGTRVLLRGYNDATTAACWLGIVKAGCIAVTTMPMLRAKELGDILARAIPSVALCDVRLLDELQTAASRAERGPRIVVFGDETADGLAARMRRRPATFENADTACDDVALIAFTSGTTGTPKAALHFHRDVLAACDTFPPAHLAPARGDVFCGTPPLAFTYGLGGLLLFPLRVGATALLLPEPRGDALLAAIEAFGATLCFAAPNAYRTMASAASRFDLRTLRACVSAGEALPVATRTLWREATGIELIDGIGSTEMLHIFIASSGAGIRPGATGTPVPGYVATILDEAGRELPRGNVGRLAVRGPTGCRYLADARQADYVRAGWNVTGDAYRLDEDGYFWHQARTDDLIVSSGYNIAGPEVEEALMAHEAVADCAVVGAPDAERGTIVKAFVVLRDGHEPDAHAERALATFVKERLAPYKAPRAIAFVDALPRTETGKLQRYKLREAETTAT